MADVRGVGLIGLGRVKDRHLKAIAELPDRFRLVAGATHDPVQFPVPVYADYRSLLQHPHVDVVVVATPPNTHAEIAIAALEAGKDVLVEKPPALSVAELQRMAEVVRRNGQVLFTGFHGSYAWQVEFMQKLLQGHPIHSIGAVYKENVDRWHPGSTWIRDKRVAGGGVLIDSGINVLSIIRRTLTPHVREVQFVPQAMNLLSPSGGVETIASVAFTINGQIQASLNLNWEWPDEEVRAIAFLMGDATYIMRFDLDRIEVLRGDVIERPSWALGQYTAMYCDFAEHLEERRSFVSMAELALIEEVYKEPDL